MAGIIGGVLGNRGNQAAPANQEEEAADLNEQPAAAAENPEEEVEGAVNNGAQGQRPLAPCRRHFYFHAFRRQLESDRVGPGS